MNLFDFASVNWLAVGVAAIASFLIGGIWYAPLFGRTWARLHGYDNEEAMKRMAASQLRVFATFLLCDLVAATALSLLLANFEAPGWSGGAMLGAFLGVGIGAMSQGVQNAAHRKPMAAYLIDASHHLLCLTAMGAIVGAWR